MKEKNIFEIWDEIGKKTPFAVRRSNWSPQYYAVVVKVNIKKWPYGDAFGYPSIHGHYTNHYDYDGGWRKRRVIPCCGCFQWTLVERAKIDESDYQQFMKILSEFPNNTPSTVTPKRMIKDETIHLTNNLLNEGKSIDEIAKERQLTPGTIYNHVGKLISLGVNIDLEKIIPKEKQEKILNAAPLFKGDKLKPIKEYLGENFSYDEIRLVLNPKN